MSFNSGLNGRAVRALVELGKMRDENELLRSIICDVLTALKAQESNTVIAEAIEDAMEALDK